MKFVVFWYQNDWGLYGRRNEMFTREIASRKEVDHVLHIEPPLSLYHLFVFSYESLFSGDEEVSDTYREHIKKAISLSPIHETESLSLFTPIKLLPKDHKFKIFEYINRLIISPQIWVITREWKDNQLKVGLVYPPNIHLETMCDSFPFDLIISDIVDFYPEKIDQYMGPLSKSDFGVAVAKKLVQKFQTELDIYHLPNGVDPQRFEGQKRTEEERIAGWVGNVNQTLNFTWIEYAAQQLSDVEFRFVGPVSSDVEYEVNRLSEGYGNITFPGPRKHTDIPEVMANFDVGLIPDSMTELAQYKDTMKLYEYLASGVPVVTSDVPPAQEFAKNIHVASSKEEFANSIEITLDEKKNHSPEKFKELASHNSWKKRIDFLFEQITGRLN